MAASDWQTVRLYLAVQGLLFIGIYEEKAPYHFYSNTNRPSANQNSLSVPLDLNITCSILHVIYENSVEFCIKFYTVLEIEQNQPVVSFSLKMVLLRYRLKFQYKIQLSAQFPINCEDPVPNQTYSINPIFFDLYEYLNENSLIFIMQFRTVFPNCRQCVTQQLGYSVVYQLLILYRNKRDEDRVDAFPKP